MATIKGHVPPLPVNGGDGHSNSPLFKSLPVEMRLQIYEEVFAGSKLSLVLTPSRLSQDPPTVPLGGRRSIFKNTGHHNFLLACRAFYDEALSSYWSKTLVFCGTYDSIAWTLGVPQTGHTFHLTYVANRISDFAKAHIKHLRQVDPFRAIAYRDTRILKLRDFLPLFPQLETCEILSQCILGPLTLREMANDASCLVHVIDKTKSQYSRAGLCIYTDSDLPIRPFSPKVLQKLVLFAGPHNPIRMAVVDHSLHTIRLKNPISGDLFETIHTEPSQSFYNERRMLALEDLEDIFKESTS